jgi:hypothetical protein
MKMKNTLTGMAVVLFTLLFVVGCPQEVSDNNERSGTPDFLVTAISIGGVNVYPLPTPGSSMETAAVGSVVINTERLPSENENPDNFYYKPVQPVTVQLSNVHESVFFAVSPPDEFPVEITLPGAQAAENVALVTRNIAVTLPDADNYPAGQFVWIKVLAADESKTEFYKIAVISETHDTAINSMSLNGNEVLELSQSGHIGPWICGTSWANAAAGLVNITNNQAPAITGTAILRNANAKIEYAKIPENADNTSEPASWTAVVPASFSNNDILAVKVTASNGKTAGYFKVTVKVGGNAFLANLTVNNQTISLGSPKADIATVEGAYRVEEGQSLTSLPVNWTVVPTPLDPEASFSWALTAQGVVPQSSEFTSPTAFDTSHNYLYIKVVSKSGESIMYYQVIYDERPRDTEHILTGGKGVPVYKFTIPPGKTWADLGEHPVVKIKLLMTPDYFDQRVANHRNFCFGELQRISDAGIGGVTFNAANYYISTGSSSFQMFMPYIFNRQLKDIAIDPNTGDYDPNIAAADNWFTVKYPLTELPDDKEPWNGANNWITQNSYEVNPNNGTAYNFYPASETSGDVYFGIGITQDAAQEYWVKELSIENADGSFKMFCDILGDGRIDSNGTNNGQVGFVRVDAMNPATASGYMREMVADPTLK